MDVCYTGCLCFNVRTESSSSISTHRKPQIILHFLTNFCIQWLILRCLSRVLPYSPRRMNIISNCYCKRRIWNSYVFLYFFDNSLCLYTFTHNIMSTFCLQKASLDEEIASLKRRYKQHMEEIMGKNKHIHQGKLV
jgi:hypothetical protein